MPKISITELDLTTPGVVNESTDVVYIPGFVKTTQKSLHDITYDADGKEVIGEYIGLEARKPHLFTSVSEFLTLCGKEAPEFKGDQKYTDLKFSKEALPNDSNAVMIYDGTADLSYVMAKELLSAGLSVLYERINTETDKDSATKEAFTKVDDEATLNELDGKFADSTSKYYYQNDDKTYGAYSDALDAPEFPKNRGDDNSPDYNVYKLTDKRAEYTQEEWLSDITVGDSSTKLFNAVYKSSDNGKTFIKVYDGTVDDDGNEVVPSVPSEAVENVIYAIPIQLLNKPDNWNTNFSDYYEAIDEEETELHQFSNKKSYKEYDISNIYIKISYDDISVVNMYRTLNAVFDTSDVTGLIDKGNFSIKYLTSGGYPVFEYDNGSLVNAMLNLAETRGDCVALIDHLDNKDRAIDPSHPNSLYQAVVKYKDSLDNGDFGAMFTPWATYNRITTDVEMNKDKEERVRPAFRAPGSYAYLTSLADSIKTNANWLAVAGAARGGVRNLTPDGMTTIIPNGVADAMQPRDNVSVNAITNIAPYGYTIWGNRTLKVNTENLVATSFLNIRNLVSDIKKTCYRAARKATFEQDTDVLWINFKSEIAKLLDRMKSGYGISGYKILRGNDHERAAEKATLRAKVIIYPTYAVEDFYITIVLQDDEVTVE